MNISFKYMSEALAKNDFAQELEIDIDVYATQDDYSIESMKIYDENNNEIDLSTLPKNEQKDIEDKAESIAYDKAYDAYMDRSIGEADALYDYMKENGE